MHRSRHLVGSLLLLAACASDNAPPPALPSPMAPAPGPTTTADAPPVTAGPPAAPVRPVTDTYFGTTVVDPYRWMEDDKSTELAPWMKAQNDYTRAQLDALPLRASLVARIRQLDHSGDRVFEAQVWGGHWFYFKRPQGHELAKYCVRDG